MPQSLARVMVHLVFSTKNREAWIAPEVRGDLHAYLGGVLDTIGCPSLQVGGTDDHVHILYALSRTRTLATGTEKVKTSTSRWMKQRGGEGIQLASRVRGVLRWRGRAAIRGALHRAAGSPSCTAELPRRDARLLPAQPLALRRTLRVGLRRNPGILIGMSPNGAARIEPGAVRQVAHQPPQASCWPHRHHNSVVHPPTSLGRNAVPRRSQTPNQRRRASGGCSGPQRTRDVTEGERRRFQKTID